MIMAAPSNDDLIATLLSPTTDFEAAILPFADPSLSESCSHILSGMSSFLGGSLKLFKVFATNADMVPL
jgi:hypothetical protein